MQTHPTALTVDQRRTLIALTRREISYPLDVLARILILPQERTLLALLGLRTKHMARAEQGENGKRLFRATKRGRTEMDAWVQAENRIHATR